MEIPRERPEPPAVWAGDRTARGARPAEVELPNGLSLELPANAGRASVRVVAGSAPKEVAQRLSEISVAFELRVQQTGGQLPVAPNDGPVVGEDVLVLDPAAFVVPEGEVPSDGELDSDERAVLDEDGRVISILPESAFEPVFKAEAATVLSEPRKDEVALKPSGHVLRILIDEANLPAGVSIAELQLQLWTGCGEDGECSTLRKFPTSVDWETGELVVSLTNQALALSSELADESGEFAVRAQNFGASYYGIGTTTASVFGDYSALPGSLSTYDVGIQTGHVEAGYSIPIPPAVGPTPSVGLSYSSGSVDNFTPSENTQAGPVGLGWSMSQSRITRAVRGCENDAGGSYVGNNCFAAADESDGFSITLNGTGSRLVKINGASGTMTTDLTANAPYQDYRLESDPAWRVRRITEGSQLTDAVALAVHGSEGYWLVNPGGQVHAHGSATWHGNGSSANPIVDILASASGNGYYLLSSHGEVYTYGDAQDHGNTPTSVTNAVKIATTTGDAGYYVLTANGRVHKFGDAASGANPEVVPLLSGRTAKGLVANGPGQYIVMSNFGEVYNYGYGGYHGNAAATSGLYMDVFADPSDNDGYTVVRVDGHLENKSSNAGVYAYNQVFDFLMDTELDPSGGMWFLRRGGIVHALGGATWLHASNPQEHRDRWEVTTPDGTAYHFGVGTARNRRVTNSVATVPIYDPGHGCRRDLCDTATSWYIDRVEDTVGNEAAYFYDASRNFYMARFNGSSAESRGYYREIRPFAVEYGNAPGAVDLPSAQVRYNFAGRPAGTAPDFSCDAFNPYCTHNEPSFYSGKRLSTVETYVRNNAGSNWRGVQDFVLDATAHTAPPSTGDLAAQNKTYLRLNLIQQQDWDPTTNAEANPPVRYTYVDLPNRADSNLSAGVPEFLTSRLSKIQNELGGEVEFLYGQSHPMSNSTDCTRNDANNVRRECDWYPIWLTYPDPDPNSSNTVQGWGRFNKWKVIEQRVSAQWGSPTVTTTYDYMTRPQWRYSENFGHTQTDAQVKAGYGYNHWSDYRGHSHVRVNTPDGGHTDHFFYTGMNGDRVDGNSTSTISATVDDGYGNNVTDHERLVGRPITSTTYGAVSNGKLADVNYVYDIHPLPATQLTFEDDSNPPSGTANWPDTRQIRTLHTYSHVFDNSGQIVAKTQADMSYDQYMNVTSVTDGGDTWPGAPADETYTLTAYTPNVGEWIVNRPHETYTWTGVDNTGTLLARQQFRYDRAINSPNWNTVGTPSNGQLTHSRSRVETADNVHEWAETATAYNGRGQTVEVEDAYGNSTTAGYNSMFGFQSYIDGPLTVDDRTDFDVDPAFGVIIEVDAPNQQVTDATYDWAGRLETVTNPVASGILTEYQYTLDQNEPSEVLTTTLLNAGEFLNTWTYVDGLGRQLQTQTKASANTNHTTISSVDFDSAGRPFRSSAPYDLAIAAGGGYVDPGNWNSVPSHTRATYHADNTQNRVRTTRYGLNQAQDATWWSQTNGLTTSNYDPLGRTTTQVVDVAGRVLSSADALGHVTAFEYDRAGRLTEVEDAEANTTQVDYYNPGGLKWRINDPDSSWTTYTYDVGGRIETQTDAESNVLSFAYDAGGRRTDLWDQTGSQSNPLIEWFYDAPGAVGLLDRSETKGDTPVTVQNHYDNRLRLSGRDWTIGGLAGVHGFDWTYRESGAVHTLEYPDGEVLTHTYNHLEEPSTLTSTVHGVLVRSATYTPWGASATLNTGNGNTEINTTFGYSSASQRLASLTSNSVGADRLEFQYQWDDGGNLTRITDQAADVGGTQYQCAWYTARNELDRAFTGNSGCTTYVGSGPDPFNVDYDYDAIGNIEKATGTGTVGGDGEYDYGFGNAGPHAVTEAGNNSYGYDDVGNMTARTVAGQATQDLSYDSQNRLSLVKEGTQTVADFVYDADGVRVVRTVNGVTTYSINELFEVEVDNSQQSASVGSPELFSPEPFTPGVVVEPSSVGGFGLPSLAGSDVSDAGVSAASGSVSLFSTVLSVLLVSKSAGPDPDDIEIRDELVAAGHTVTVIDDNNLTSTSGNGHDVVVVSDTTSTSQVTNKLESAAVPVVFLKPWVFDDNELTGSCSSSCGSSGSSTALVNIVDDSHPIAAGFSNGSVTVLTSAQTLNFGKPGTGATVIANQVADSTKASIFAYDAGASMDGGFVAPERRVGLWMRKAHTDDTTADGWTLFVAAVEWAGGAVGGPANAAPVVDAGNAQTITLPATASLVGSVSDDGLPSGATVTQTWSKQSGPGTVTFASPTSLATSASFTTAGTYVLKLTASDTALSGSDTVTITVNADPGSGGGGSGGPADVLLVSKSAGPDPDDIEIRDELVAAGHTVTVIDDNNLTSTSGDTYDVVVVSDTVSESQVTNKLESATVPVVFLKPWVFDDNELTSNCTGSCGNSGTATSQINIVDASHPIAAGFSTGAVTVLTSSQTLNYGKPGPGAVVVANQVADSTKASIFAYETGAAMDSGFIAPERRVGLWMRKAQTDDTTADGWTLFVQAVEWAANLSTGTTNTAPTVDAGSAQTVTVLSASLDGTVSDPDGLPSGATVTQTWSKDSGPGTVTFANASAVDTTATFSVDGTYVLNLEATDTDLTDFDTVTVTVNSQGSQGGTRVTSGLVVLYEFDETSGSTVADTSNHMAPLDLTIANTNNASFSNGYLDVTGDTLISSAGAATKVNTAVSASDEITVEAWVDPANLTQNGPARIVTVSSTPTARNVTLGQGVFGASGDQVEARLRSTGTGTNGTPATQTATQALDGSLQHVVFTRDSSGTTRVYVDGTQVVSSTASGDLSNWDNTMALGLAAELDSSRFWHGRLHLVAIYDRALTSTEVGDNYTAGADPGVVPPVTVERSYYRFGGRMIGHSIDGTLTTTAANHLGSTEITNTGGTINRQTYLPFGGVRSSAANTLTTDHTYTGQVDDGLGWMHYRARQYDPLLGRFMQADTITVDGLNRYTYVRNNPLNGTDPTGRCTAGLDCPMAPSDEARAVSCGYTLDRCGNGAQRIVNTLLLNAHEFCVEDCGFALGFLRGYAMAVASPYIVADAIITDPFETILGLPEAIYEGLVGCFESTQGAGECVGGGFVAGTFGCKITGCKPVGRPDVATPRAPSGAVDDALRLACSFSAETGVLMADGTRKPISAIEVGDWVLAEDPETGERGARQVTHLWVHEDTIVSLEIDGHDVATTVDHPFWNATDSEWQRADALDTGDLLLAADGHLVGVGDIDFGSARTTTAYNLTIDDIHTYFVAAGDEEVLVHNTCPNPGNLKKLTTPQIEDAVGTSVHQFKYDILGEGAQISRFDVFREGDVIYLVEKSTGNIVETGYRIPGAG